MKNLFILFLFLLPLIGLGQSETKIQEKVIYKVYHYDTVPTNQCPYGIKDCKSKHSKTITTTETFCTLWEAKEAGGEIDSVIYRKIWNYRVKYNYKNFWIEGNWESLRKVAVDNLKELKSDVATLWKNDFPQPCCFKLDSLMMWTEVQK